MPSAKDIHVAPISAKDAGALVKRVHYSGKVVQNSQLHLGVFLDGRLEGALQFGPPMMKRNLIGLVEGTEWNGFLELNRMAFSERLPRNSESRALGVAMRLIRKQYPHIEWLVSFADGTQCGDGTIYRAAGFVLTKINGTAPVRAMPNGEKIMRMTITKGKHIRANGGRAGWPEGSVPLPGYQLRYLYFINPKARERLTVPILPFSKIDEMGAGMYRGKARPKDQDLANPARLGGETPTRTLHNSDEAV